MSTQLGRDGVGSIPSSQHTLKYKSPQQGEADQIFRSGKKSNIAK